MNTDGRGAETSPERSRSAAAMSETFNSDSASNCLVATRDCSDCLAHGQVIRVLRDFCTHCVLVDSNRSTRAWTAGADESRRATVRLPRVRDDGLIPIDRGARRERIVQVVTRMLNTQGPKRPDLLGAFPGLTTRERPGPVGASGLTLQDVRARVDDLRSQGMTVWKAREAVGATLGSAPESVCKGFCRRRHDQ